MFCSCLMAQLQEIFVHVLHFFTLSLSLYQNLRARGLQITSNGLILPLYLARAKSEAPIYTF